MGVTKSVRRERRRVLGLPLLLVGLVVGGGPLLSCSVSGSDAPHRQPSSLVPALDVGIPALAAPAAPVEGPSEEPEAVARVARTAPPSRSEASPEAPVETPAPPETPAGPLEVVCPSDDEAPVRVFISPFKPRPGQPLRITAVSDEALPGVGMAIVQPTGRAPLASVASWGGPPYAWSVVLDEAPAGRHEVLVTSGDPARPFACARVAVVAPTKGETLPPIATGAWPIERAWDPALENLYSAWVARLFLVDPGAKAGWRPLHQVVRDPKRNILYGHLGLREDEPASKVKVVLGPDCADTPFFLRAYFSWKMRLPFAIRRCLRGNAIEGPECNGELITNLTPEWNHVGSIVDRFNKFVNLTVARTAHSGTVRTVPDDPMSDLVPLALSPEAIRPGTVFADPNGHVLVVTRWIGGTQERMGMLLAIDAHPDLTVSHKRFSAANFYFAAHLRTGGFKAFRPAVYERGAVRFATNAELPALRGQAGPSLEQYAFAQSVDFYRTMDRLLNPDPLDPVAAYRSRMEALVELLEERVSAVQVGIDYMEMSGWRTVEMPKGGAIFETTGPWEDYSTPARDLRLLLAFDEFQRFPRYLSENRELFRIPAGKSLADVRAELDAEWDRAKDELTITYRRSDRSTWTLTLGQVVDRTESFEQAYNPNDCPEIRWGAREGGDEFSTCGRRAPGDQRFAMRAYRVWHEERRRPAGF